jgi:cytochrome c biogenesis protein CcmG, thiol:disulfide interchange protein DsbE
MSDLNESYETAQPTAIPDGVLQCCPPPAPQESSQSAEALPAHSRTRRQRVVAVVLLILVVAGALYIFLPGSGESGGGDIVALVNGTAIHQSDVDIYISLTKALNSAQGSPVGSVSEEDALNQLVYQTLALEDARKHNYPPPTPDEVTRYINNFTASAKLSATGLDQLLDSNGVARSVLTDAVQARLTIDDYINQRVARSGLTSDQRDLLINNWRAALYDPKATQISFPTPLREAGPAPKQGRQAPEVAGTDLSTGKPIKLSDLKGHPVLVNFWATWCTPCKTEMPEIVRAYNQYKDSKGLRVLAVSIEGPSAKDKVLAFMHDYKMTFATITDDDNQSLSLAYHIISIPTSAFVDQGGVVQWMQLGAMSEPQLAMGLDRILK